MIESSQVDVFLYSSQDVLIHPSHETEHKTERERAHASPRAIPLQTLNLLPAHCLSRHTRKQNPQPEKEPSQKCVKIVSSVIHRFSSLLFRPSQRVSWSGRPHLEPVSASLHFFSTSFVPVARRSQRSYPWENARCLFKKCPAPSHSWFLNRFTSSHETNQFIYLVKRCLTES